MVAEPIDRPPKTLLEGRARFEAERVARLRRVQGSSRLAVRLARVPDEITVETGEGSDQRRQVPDRDLATGPEVDRIRILVTLCRENDPFHRVVDVEELARGGARTPDLDRLGALIDRFDELLDQRRDDVRDRGMELVSRTVEVHGQQVDD